MTGNEVRFCLTQGYSLLLRVSRAGKHWKSSLIQTYSIVISGFNCTWLGSRLLNPGVVVLWLLWPSGRKFGCCCFQLGQQCTLQGVGFCLGCFSVCPSDVADLLSKACHFSKTIVWSDWSHPKSFLSVSVSRIRKRLIKKPTCFQSSRTHWWTDSQTTQRLSLSCAVTSLGSGLHAKAIATFCNLHSMAAHVALEFPGRKIDTSIFGEARTVLATKRIFFWWKKWGPRN